MQTKQKAQLRQVYFSDIEIKLQSYQPQHVCVRILQYTPKGRDVATMDRCMEPVLAQIGPRFPCVLCNVKVSNARRVPDSQGWRDPGVPKATVNIFVVGLAPVHENP